MYFVEVAKVVSDFCLYLPFHFCTWMFPAQATCERRRCKCKPGFCNHHGTCVAEAQANRPAATQHLHAEPHPFHQISCIHTRRSTSQLYGYKVCGFFPRTPFTRACKGCALSEPGAFATRTRPAVSLDARQRWETLLASHLDAKYIQTL